MSKSDHMQKGMTNHSPKSTDASSGKSGSPGGSVNDMPTRKSPPSITAPGPRNA